MIKVVFTYKTKKENLPELMAKFQASGDPQFHSAVSNTGIKMYRKEEGEQVYIILDIFYNSLADYQERSAFERSQAAWNEIWFNKENKHEELSVEVLELMN